MARYRKKPVVIEAIQFREDNDREVCDFLGADYAGFRHVATETSDHELRILIETLEGPITASPGDYIIRGVQGEHYPCKPDIFAATYEPED